MSARKASISGDLSRQPRATPCAARYSCIGPFSAKLRGIVLSLYYHRIVSIYHRIYRMCHSGARVSDSCQPKDPGVAISLFLFSEKSRVSEFPSIEFRRSHKKGTLSPRSARVAGEPGVSGCPWSQVSCHRNYFNRQ